MRRNEETKVIRVVVFGIGGVGRAFLRRILMTRQELQKNHDTMIQVIGVATRQFLVLEPLLPLSDEVLQRLASGECRVADLPNALEFNGIADQGVIDGQLWLPSSGDVMVDLTAEDSVEQHRHWLRRGQAVVTANKLPVCSEHAATLTVSPRYRYGATVGAGLGVIDRLRSLKTAGEVITQVRAMVSGTIGFCLTLCQRENIPFAEAFWRAKEAGYTEPHGADDLLFIDGKRKACILANEIGLKIALSDIKAKGLVPEGDRELSPEQFLEVVPTHTAKVDQLIQQAMVRGMRLRYLLEMNSAGVGAGLHQVNPGEVFWGLDGADNAFVIHSKPTFEERPLVIKGPGAGADATAFGVLNDVLSLAKS